MSSHQQKSSIPNDTIKQLDQFINASPSPWHAVEQAASLLNQQGYTRLDESSGWQLQHGGKYYVIRGESSIVAFSLPSQLDQIPRFNISAAHTDSPCLRIKPNPVIRKDDLSFLGVEVYGGLMIATCADRDLAMAGRVTVEQNGDLHNLLFRQSDASLRLPTLAIHLNREVNEQGLRFDKQTEIPLLCTQADLSDTLNFKSWLAELLNKDNQTSLPASAIESWDICVFDTQQGSRWGKSQEFYANSQLDNLASCHALLSGFLDTQAPDNQINILALFDHEEIGSQSFKGADGPFLGDVLQRLREHLKLSEDTYRASLAKSKMISADMSHAYHPSHSKFYEPEHKLKVNHGPAIKINANQRYASDAPSVAFFQQLCKKANVPYQLAIHRTDLACGSTLGPLASSQLGILTVDVGNPMWSMHSLRESCGTLDHHYLTRVITTFYQGG